MNPVQPINAHGCREVRSDECLASIATLSHGFTHCGWPHRASQMTTFIAIFGAWFLWPVLREYQGVSDPQVMSVLPNSQYRSICCKHSVGFSKQQAKKSSFYDKHCVAVTATA